MRLVQTEATNIRNRSTVTLERSEESGLEPINLTIYALPPTHADEAEAEIPSPQPPFKGLSRNRKGRLDKNDEGKPIKMYDEHDPEYVKESQAVRQLQSLKMVIDALDPNEVSFETQRDGVEPRAYYEAVRQEMTDYGVSLGDLVKLIEAVADVSAIDTETANKAKADFSDEED